MFDSLDIIIKFDLFYVELFKIPIELKIKVISQSEEFKKSIETFLRHKTFTFCHLLFLPLYGEREGER